MSEQLKIASWLDPADHEMYFCRGKEKGCDRNIAIEGKCERCITGKPEETVEDIYNRIQQGDA